MSIDNSSERSGHADEGWDNYQERVTRNEGRLGALERLVAETRESDRLLVEQRIVALLELVEVRASAVLDLGREERAADRTHLETITSEAEKRGQLALSLLREVYDTAIKQNYEQSREAIHALEQRRDAATNKLEQMVRQWRDSDREARELFATDNKRHLDQLNHNNERMREFQAQSVTRELWQSEKDASIKREGLLRDQIIALDRTVLTMTPIAQSEKAHAEIVARMETSIAASVEVLDNKIGVVSDKLGELKEYRDTTTGRAAGYQAFYGWGIAAITVIISIIVLANAFIGK